MRVTLAYEHRFVSCGDGTVGTTGPYPYAYWSRFLRVFDEVEVVARVAVASGDDDTERSDGERVRFRSLPDYRGLPGLVRRWPRLRRELRAAAHESEAAILRVPGAVGSLLAAELRRLGRPYGAQIVGDPRESLRDLGVVSRYVVAPLAARGLRRQAREASATTYVTREVLQRRYPPAGGRFTVSVSDVSIPDELVEGRAPIEPSSSGEPPRLVFVGSLMQRYKGLDVLLRAVARCRERGVACALTVVGDGVYRAENEALACTLGLDDQVHFVGALPADGVLAELLAADLYVHPARTEGLPRSLVEAMAAGLPCVATSVGGIPELLESEVLVPPGDASALADRIERLLSSPESRKRHAARNVDVAFDFRESARDEKLSRFYREVALAAKA